jgi:hypothetical protein
MQDMCYYKWPLNQLTDFNENGLRSAKVTQMPLFLNPHFQFGAWVKMLYADNPL